MDWKKFLSLDLAKRVGKVLYTEAIYPAAEEYVKSTDNSYDDSALHFVDGFVQDFLDIKDK